MKPVPQRRDFMNPPTNYKLSSESNLATNFSTTFRYSTPVGRFVLLLPLLEPWLGLPKTQQLSSAMTTGTVFSNVTRRHEWLCSNKPILKPHDPLSHRVRGPLRDKLGLGSSHTVPSPYLILHLSWCFLDSPSQSMVISASSIMLNYARLRAAAITQPVFSLKVRRPAAAHIPPLCPTRAWTMARALLRFDFVYADFMRWLGGEYTNQFRDWEDVVQYAEHVRTPQPDPDCPPVDFDRAIAIAVGGAPIQGILQTEFSHVQDRERYDNHRSLHQVVDSVRQKFAKEESLSYQIAFPRFLWAFIDGLFISPITFVQKDTGSEGRICPDPSNTISDLDTGNANAQIPAAGTKGLADENPSVFYGDAFMRHLRWLWNLRVARPNCPILGHVDDISAAYHRVLYHPAMGVAFAQVFQEFLMIPCGLIFGARNSPSWYMLLGEWRASLAATGDFGHWTSRLAESLLLEQDDKRHQEEPLTHAAPDNINKGFYHLASQFSYQSFVDDTAVAHYPDHIRTAVNRSVLSAYVIFGFPAENRRPPPLNPLKWDNKATSVYKYLGFLIDTKRMVVIWPVEKRQRLARWITDIWLHPSHPRVSPKQASQIIGLVRHAARICPLGILLANRLQYDLNDLVSHANHDNGSRWWGYARWQVSPAVRADLRMLLALLDDNEHHPAWNCHIGLLVPRQVNAVPKSDASYEGIGGFCRELHYMWRVSSTTLRECGWVIPQNPGRFAKIDFTTNTHINVLEFLAIIINLWILLKRLDHPSYRGSYNNHDGTQLIALVLADNTTALSWLQHPDRVKRTSNRNLVRFLSQMLLLRDFPLQISSSHIPGHLNVEADALSRFTGRTSWASLTNDASLNLQHLTAYQVPHKLLTFIWSLVSQQQIVDISEKK